MKKLYIALLVASFITPSVSIASIDTNLKYGSRGGDVTELQEFLIDKGFLVGQSTGNFFALTRKAVVAYQSSVGLPATGYVGPMSRSKINDDLSQTNAPAVLAEISETGTTTISINKPALVSGCSSVVGFSTTTGSPCSPTTAPTSPPQIQTQTTEPQNTPPVIQITNTPTPTPTPTLTPISTVNEPVPTEISIQNQVCNLSQTNLKTEYQLYDLLQNGNIDGRIFMNAYILKGLGQNYYTSNPSAKMTITTSDHSNDKTINGSGNTGPCGYHYPYEFYATRTGTYTITFSVPEFNLSKTITLNIVGAEKPAVGSSGITISTSQKETDYPLSELANLDSTSNVKYWFQTSKPSYRYNISAWCSDVDTPSSKIDLVSHLEKDGLYYYRGYFRSGDKFSGITTCKFIHSANTSMTIFSESDTVTFDAK